MRNYRQLIALTFILYSTSLPAIAMENKYLSVLLQCPDQPDCVFDGNDMAIKVTIRNISSSVIKIPFSYIRRIGPVGKLIDNTTQREISLQSGMADHSLANTFTDMMPGDSLETNSILYIEQILFFKQEHVDITAKVGLKGKIWIDQNPKFTIFEEYTTMQIVGKNNNSSDRNK